MKINIVSTFLLLASLTCGAQQKIPMYGSKDNALLCDQARISLVLADRMLDAYPPTDTLNCLERQATLELIDNVLHDTRNDYSDAIIAFSDSRMGKVLADFDTPLLPGQMRVYKFYNAGTLVRTNEATVAFDVVRGRAYPSERPVISDSIARLLVCKADALFLSHNHSDHVDPAVVNMFHEAGKPVVAPSEALVNDADVRHIEKGDTVRFNLDLPSRQSLRVTILPGHQDDMQNNISVVTFPNNRTVAQTGDQWTGEDVPWIIHARDFIPPLDVLLMNCWVNMFDETVDGFAPRLLVTYHENELGHSIGHREPYMLTHRLLESPRRAAPLMTWGEWFTLD